MSRGTPVGRHSRARVVAMGWAMLAALATPAPQAAIRLEVTAAEGQLPAAARANVMAWLSLSRYRERDDLDAELLDRLQARASREARTALRPFGFYAATAVAWVGPVPGSAGRDWRARVRIVPGPRVRWLPPEHRVTGPATATVHFRDALRNHAIRVGEPLAHADHDALKGELQRTAAALGYLESRFEQAELQVDPAKREARSILHFVTGPRYRFGAATFSGDLVLEESLLRRFLRWQEGAAFDASLLLGTQFALDDSLYFSGVEVVTGAPDPVTTTVPVTLQLTRAPRHRLAASVGYATDTQGRASAQWEDRRVNRRGHRAAASMRWSSTGRALEGRYALPVGDPALEELSFLLGAEELLLADAQTTTTRLRSALTRVRGRWQHVWALTADHATTRTAGSATTDTLVVPSLTLASSPRGLSRAALSARTLPGLGSDLATDGFMVRIEGSTGALGSRSSFVRLQVRDSGQRALGDRWRWNWRAEAGSSLVRDFTVLPASYRFFAGGDRSVRGFALNDLGPRDADGLRSGGRHLLVASLELERKLPRQLAAAVFIDAGNAFNAPGEGLAVALGFGLRYRLPVINLGLDIAQAIHAPGGGPRPGPRVHLSLSPAFPR